MKRIYKAITFRKIRLGQWLSLIFFAFFFACKEEKESAISIAWKNDQATGIIIPKSLVAHTDEDDIKKDLNVKLGKGEQPMMGDYRFADDHILFSPLIPLTRGLTYNVFFRQQKLGSVSVAAADLASAPRVLALYPTNDTLPENLLKLYLQFSTSMRQGESQKYISLLKGADTMADVFLDLQPELWNKEGTILTVWLDPGRIKRDLIPNKKFGNPLQTGGQYTLVISDQWKDVQGRALATSFTRRFQVAPKDTVCPDPASWSLSLPKTASRDPLFIRLGDPLDYLLLQETIFIYDQVGKRLMGEWQVLSEEKVLRFEPEEVWRAGDYTIQVAPHLEDVAGNNLERPFDRDVLNINRKKISREITFRLMQIGERKN